VLGLIGQKTSAGALERARRQMQAAGRVMGDFMQQHDIFLTSTWGRPPVRVGELGVTRAEALQAAALDLMPLKALLDFALHKMAKGRLAAVPNTQLYNQTGAPAVSVPLHWSAAGLPIGVQLGGRMGDEATLIRLSAQLEQARPWARRKPVLLG
jgi:amidase